MVGTGNTVIGSATYGAPMERTVTVVPEAGLHARPAAAFVRTANGFEAAVEIGRANAAETVDARSMLSVTALGVEHGDEVRLVATGTDAEAALDALEAVLTTPEGEGGADAKAGAGGAAEDGADGAAEDGADGAAEDGADGADDDAEPGTREGERS